MKDSSTSSLKPWLICLAAALFFCFVFFQLTMFNSISPHIMKAFQLNSTQLGYLSSSYFFADALAIIPAGLLLDRYSSRWLMLLVMTTCIIATFVLATSNNFTVAITCRAITGVGNAFAFLGSMQLAARWLPPKRLALGMGLIITMIMLGGIIAQTPLALLTQDLGWRDATKVNACIGFIFLCFMLLVLRDHPSKLTQTKPKTLFTNLQIAIKNPQNWLCATYTSLMNTPIVIMGELWGIMYLKQTHALSMTAAANIASWMFIGMIIGSPGMGWLSDKIKRRKTFMLTSTICILLTTVFIAYSSLHSSFLLSTLFFLLGFFSAAQVIGYPTITESNPPAITSTALSIAAIILNLVAFFVQPLFGWLMHYGWHGETLHGSPIYSAENYHVAMIILPITFVISFFLALKVRETYCKPSIIQEAETISVVTQGQEI